MRTINSPVETEPVSTTDNGVMDDLIVLTALMNLSVVC